MPGRRSASMSPEDAFSLTQSMVYNTPLSISTASMRNSFPGPENKSFPARLRFLQMILLHFFRSLLSPGMIDERDKQVDPIGLRWVDVFVVSDVTADVEHKLLCLVSVPREGIWHPPSRFSGVCIGRAPAPPRVPTDTVVISTIASSIVTSTV